MSLHNSLFDVEATYRSTQPLCIKDGRNMAELVNMLISFTVLFGSWMLLMRWLSGWSAVEKNYACKETSTTGQISRASFRWVGSRFRLVQLTLSVELYPRFLWLRPSFPLNLALKSLCIPWESIQITEVHRNMFRTKISLHVLECPFRIHVFGKAGESIHAAVAKAKAAVATPHNSSLNPDARQQSRSV